MRNLVFDEKLKELREEKEPVAVEDVIQEKDEGAKSIVVNNERKVAHPTCHSCFA